MALIKQIEQNKIQFIGWRHALHQQPGIGFEEHFAANFIAEKLKSFGFDEVHTQIGKTGIVGVLKGATDNGEAIGLRADMDALPIEEANTFSHRSQVDSCMHACGHDGHSASLLATAWYLSQHRDEFSGRIYFIFQPAEEGLGGGLAMIEDGLFQRFTPKRIYAFHNMPGFERHHIFMKAGAFLAGASFFDIEIKGKGGHAAFPHTAIDPTLMMSQIIVQANTIVSRDLDPIQTAILSFTDCESKTNSNNVIPDNAKMRGCIRFFDEAVGTKMKHKLQAIVEHTVSMHGGEASVRFNDNFIPLINDPTATQIALQVAQEVVGCERATDKAQVITASEDFSFMLKQVPGCYVGIGAGKEATAVHNPHYDFDDGILAVAASYFVTLVRHELSC